MRNIRNKCHMTGFVWKITSPDTWRMRATSVGKFAGTK
jgi:hypothetical protein